MFLTHSNHSGSCENKPQGQDLLLADLPEAAAPQLCIGIVDRNHLLH